MTNNLMEKTMIRVLGIILITSLLRTICPTPEPLIGAASLGKTSTALSSFDNQANALLSKMTLEEKIGQMTQAEQDALKDITDIEKYFLGSVLSGGNSDPKEGNSLRDWTEMYDRCQSH